MPGNFLDVTLSLFPAGPKYTYRAQWSSPDTEFPMEQGDSEIGLPRDLFDSPLLTRKASPNPNSFSVLIGEAKQLGAELYERIFQGNIKDRYDDAFEIARRVQRRLRLRVHLPDELENLPFELLYDRRRDLFVAANEFTTLVRGSVGKTVDLASVKFPLRLIIVAAQPTGVSPISVDHEIDIITRGLSGLIDIGIWQVDVLRGHNTLQQIRDRSDRRNFHVMHYIGHGVINGDSPALVLEDEHGQVKLADTSAISAIMVGYTNLRLVVLSSCYGGQGVEGKPYASLAHHLLRTEIPAVVSMQRKIADNSAIRFTGEMYRELAEGRPVDECVNSARTSLMLDATNDSALDWFNPQVYLRSVSGHLFASVEDLFPWERMVNESLAKYDVAAAIRTFEKAQRWNAVSEIAMERFGCHLASLAEMAIGNRNWELLAALHYQCKRFMLQNLAFNVWDRILSNRKEWRVRIVERLSQDLASGDLGRASGAITEGKRVMEMLLHNPSEACAMMYGDDRHLFEQFWAEDARQLQGLLQSYGGPILTPQLLQVTDALEFLGSHKGLPTIPPRAFEEGLQLTRVAQVGQISSLEAKLFVHPVVDADRLRSVRDELLLDSSVKDNSLDQLLVRLRSVVADDFPLLLRALGKTDNAIACWLSQLQVCRHRSEKLQIYHHLSLTAFSTDITCKLGHTLAFGELSLACWAIILSDGTACLGNDRRASDTVAQADLTTEYYARNSERLRSSILTILCASACEKDSSKGSIADLRDIVLVESNEISACLKSDSVCPSNLTFHQIWFNAELSGARLMRELGCSMQASQIDPPLGLGATRHFGVVDQLTGFYRELISSSHHPLLNEDGSESDVKGYDTQALIMALESQAARDFRPNVVAIGYGSIEEFRILFSVLRMFWFRVIDRDPEAPLQMLGRATLELPSAHPTWNERDVEFLMDIPEQWRVRISPCSYQDFRVENPLHASLDQPSRTFSDDLRRVYLHAIIESIRKAQREFVVELTTEFSQQVKLIVLLASGLDDVHRAILDLQDESIAKSAEHWATDNADDISRGIELLEQIAELDRNTSIGEALCRGYMRLAEVQVSGDGEAEEVLACLVKARQWDSQSIEACEGLCSAMIGRIAALVSVGQTAEANRHINELRDQLAFAPVSTGTLIRIEKELKGLESNGNQSADKTLEEVAAMRKFAYSVDGAWLERSQLAEQAFEDGRLVAALDALCDAVLLVGDDSPESQVIRDQFLRFCDATEDVARRSVIIDKASRCFPDDVVIQNRLRRFENIARLLNPE